MMHHKSGNIYSRSVVFVGQSPPPNNALSARGIQRKVFEVALGCHSVTSLHRLQLRLLWSLEQS